MRPTPEKLSAIKNWPTLKNKRDLQSFLGAVNFLRDFVRDYQCYLNAFSDLLSSKGTFYWNERHAKAFQQLKQALVKAPALTLPDTSQPFYVATDASDHALGAVVLQEFDGRYRPIAFSSRRLGKQERRKDSFTH